MFDEYITLNHRLAVATSYSDKVFSWLLRIDDIIILGEKFRCTTQVHSLLWHISEYLVLNLHIFIIILSLMEEKRFFRKNFHEKLESMSQEVKQFAPFFQFTWMYSSLAIINFYKTKSHALGKSIRILLTNLLLPDYLYQDYNGS